MKTTVAARDEPRRLTVKHGLLFMKQEDCFGQVFEPFNSNVAALVCLSGTASFFPFITSVT